MLLLAFRVDAGTSTCCVEVRRARAAPSRGCGAGEGRGGRERGERTWGEVGSGKGRRGRKPWNRLRVGVVAGWGRGAGGQGERRCRGVGAGVGGRRRGSVDVDVVAWAWEWAWEWAWAGRAPFVPTLTCFALPSAAYHRQCIKFHPVRLRQRSGSVNEEAREGRREKATLGSGWEKEREGVSLLFSGSGSSNP